jgi:hypothetical protein
MIVGRFISEKNGKIQHARFNLFLLRTENFVYGGYLAAFITYGRLDFLRKRNDVGFTFNAHGQRKKHVKSLLFVIKMIRKRTGYRRVVFAGYIKNYSIGQSAAATGYCKKAVGYGIFVNIEFGNAVYVRGMITKSGIEIVENKSLSLLKMLRLKKHSFLPYYFSVT